MFGGLLVQRFLFLVERKGSVKLVDRNFLAADGGLKGYRRRVNGLVEIVWPFEEVFAFPGVEGSTHCVGESGCFWSKLIVILCSEIVVGVKHSRSKGDSKVRVVALRRCRIFEVEWPWFLLFWLFPHIEALLIIKSGPIITLPFLILGLEQIIQRALQLAWEFMLL